MSEQAEFAGGFVDKDGKLRRLLTGELLDATPQHMHPMNGVFKDIDGSLHDLTEIGGGGGGPESDPVFVSWRDTTFASFRKETEDEFDEAVTVEYVDTGDKANSDALAVYIAGAVTKEYVDDQNDVQDVRTAAIESAVAAFNTALNSHITSDDSRWQAVNKMISDLRVELKQFAIDIYAGTEPEYDYTQTQTILMAGGLVSLVDQGTWTVPTNGAIQAQVGGLLGAGLTVSVNGNVVWTAPLNLLVPLNSPEIRVNAGDEISYGGVVGIGQTIQVEYFPNKGT